MITKRNEERGVSFRLGLTPVMDRASGTKPRHRPPTLQLSKTSAG
jgi:hypothetical protein